MNNRFPFLGIALLTVVFLFSACRTGSESDRFAFWTRYEGEPGGSSYSALDQINRSNVDRLEIAWTYETPDAAELNPVVVDSVMYVVGDDGEVDLRQGLGVSPELVGRIASQSPGVVYQDLIVLGSTTGEGYYPVGALDPGCRSRPSRHQSGAPVEAREREFDRRGLFPLGSAVP